MYLQYSRTARLAFLEQVFGHRQLELHLENSDKYSGAKGTRKVSINCISKRLCHSGNDTKTDGSPSKNF